MNRKCSMQMTRIGWHSGQTRTIQALTYWLHRLAPVVGASVSLSGEAGLWRGSKLTISSQKKYPHIIVGNVGLMTPYLLKTFPQVSLQLREGRVAIPQALMRGFLEPVLGWLHERQQEEESSNCEFPVFQNIVTCSRGRLYIPNFGNVFFKSEIPRC